MVVNNMINVRVSWISKSRERDNRCTWRLDSELYLRPPNGHEWIYVLIGNMMAMIIDEVTNWD